MRWVPLRRAFGLGGPFGPGNRRRSAWRTAACFSDPRAAIRPAAPSV